MTSTAHITTRHASPLHRRPADGRVLSVGITVRDVGEAAKFYGHVLGFHVDAYADLAEPELEGLTGLSRARVIRLMLGDELLDLTQCVTPHGRPMPSDSRCNDLWFQHVAIVVRDMDAAFARLLAAGVEPVSLAPQRIPDWNAVAGGIRATYFRDRDGHFLELLEFPPDKGDVKWRRPSDKLFLGIDHTAIVVRSTAASLGFYRDRLGMQVTAATENYGIEQERLCRVEGAHLRITTLRGAAGPGVELLEYVAPRTGRPRPIDARADDLLHWRTVVAVADLDGVSDGIGAPVASAGFGVATLVSAYHRRMRVSDPDGHVIELVGLSRKD